MKSEFFDADYYERGIETGKSCYQNYHWLPEYTIPMAMTFIDYLQIKPYHEVLDYGCSKGYLVKALRWLNRQAWGVDISEYAIQNVDPEVKEYCSLVEDMITGNQFWDFIIAKDVFEHIEKDNLAMILRMMIPITRQLFVVVPLGEDDRYRAECNGWDKSHIICESEDWWKSFFEKNDWGLVDFKFQLKGCKDNYYQSNPKAHGFFRLMR